MNCSCICEKEPSLRRRRGTDTCCVVHGILSTRVIFVVLATFSLILMVNVLRVSNHLLSVSKISSDMRRFTNVFHMMGHSNHTRRIKHYHRVGRKDIYEILAQPKRPLTPSPFENKSVTEKPEVCRSCFRHDFKYIIDNPDICDTYGDNPIDVLILIFSTHNSRERRDAIRETWLQVSDQNTANIRYAFLFGNVSDGVQQTQLEEENRQYHDIVQENFQEAYKNLTYKTIMAFKWATTKCNNSRFLMKTDDDMYVNTKNLLNVLNGNEEQLQRAVGGSCMRRGKPVRNRMSKWYASLESYPRKAYPGFCSGTGYVTSMSVARKIYDITRNVRYFHLEDVYVGICVWRLGLSLLSIRGFSIDQVRPRNCHYKNSRMVTSHYISARLMRFIWAMDCRNRTWQSGPDYDVEKIDPVPVNDSLVSEMVDPGERA